MIIRERLQDINWEPLNCLHKKIHKFLNRHMTNILNWADNLDPIQKGVANNKANALANEEFFWMIQCEQYCGYKPSINFQEIRSLYYALNIGVEVDYGQCEGLLGEVLEAHLKIRNYIDDNYVDIILPEEDSLNEQSLIKSPDQTNLD